MTTPEPGDSNPPPPESHPNPDHPPLHPAGAEAPRTLSSNELLQGGREVLIRHDDMVYRLRLTRNGKLILVK